jgi:hypothetical protein
MKTIKTGGNLNLPLKGNSKNVESRPKRGTIAALVALGGIGGGENPNTIRDNRQRKAEEARG